MELGNVNVDYQHDMSDGLPDQLQDENQLNAMQQRFRVPNLSRQDFDQCRQQNVCFNCRKPGHIARECRSQGRNNYNNQSKNGQGQQQRQ